MGPSLVLISEVTTGSLREPEMDHDLQRGSIVVTQGLKSLSKSDSTRCTLGSAMFQPYLRSTGKRHNWKNGELDIVAAKLLEPENQVHKVMRRFGTRLMADTNSETLDGVITGN